MTSQSKIFRAACVALVIVSACNSNDDRSRPEQVLPKDAVFYFDDLSGTVVSTADHVGLPHGATTRYPYGEVRHSSGRPEPFGFAGREADASGLFDFSVRAYRPETSLFLSPDPLALFKSDEIIGSPGRAPAYAYSSSDPVNFVDPSGRSPESVQDNMTRQLQNLQREIAQSDNFTDNATSASKPADSFDRAVERYRDALRESGNLSSEHGVRVVLGVEERLKNERLEEQQARSEGRMTAEWAREINAENTQRAWDEQRSFSGIPFNTDHASQFGIKYVIGWAWANISGYVLKFSGPPPPPPPNDATGRRM